MKKKYRIEIRTEKSGRKVYQAQESYMFFWFDIKVLDDKGSAYPNIYECLFYSIEDAEEAINKRREKLKEEDLKSVISIEYKYLN
jgi:hypothetical protein